MRRVRGGEDLKIYTVTEARGYRPMFVEWGMKGEVIPYMVEGFKALDHPITPLKTMPRRLADEVTLSAGGSIWMGGPKNLTVGGIVTIETGSLDVVRRILNKKLNKKSDHPSWIGFWLLDRFFALRRETAETLLGLTYSKEVADWDAEYLAGLLDVNKELKKSPRILIEDRLPEVKGEH